jgi:hypothetical protein
MQAWSVNAPPTACVGVTSVTSVTSVIGVIWERWEAPAMSSYASVSTIATGATIPANPTHWNLATNRSATRPAEPNQFASLEQSGVHIVGTGIALHRIASQRAQNDGVHLR